MKLGDRNTGTTIVFGNSKIKESDSKNLLGVTLEELRIQKLYENLQRKVNQTLHVLAHLSNFIDHIKSEILMNSIISSLADYRASNLDITRTCEIPLQRLVCKDGELELVMLKEKVCYNLSALIVENQKSSKNQKCMKCTCTEKILSTS